MSQTDTTTTIGHNSNLFGEALDEPTPKTEKSGYARQEDDRYFTPVWPTEDVLLPNVEFAQHILECAVGDGGIAEVLKAHGHIVFGIDINPDPAVDLVANFLTWNNPDKIAFDVVSNTPYGDLGRQFIEWALEITKPHKGKVAFLFPLAFARAITRQHLFENCQQFTLKIELTKRISWTNIEQKLDKNGKPVMPAQDHCWLVWDWNNQEPSKIIFAPKRGEADMPLFANSETAVV